MSDRYPRIIEAINHILEHPIPLHADEEDWPAAMLFVGVCIAAQEFGDMALANMMMAHYAKIVGKNQQ